MSVYVDDMMPCVPNKNWRYTQACHMIADSDDDLHAMAAKIGLRREWFQTASILRHYDLTASKRELAIRFGAIPIDRHEVGRRISEARAARAKSEGSGT